MIKSEYLEEIKKYILKAKFNKVYNADFFNEDTSSSDLTFPSFEQIFDYVNKSDNSDKFFSRLSLTLKNYKEYIENKNCHLIDVSIAPLEKRVLTAEKTINKLLSNINASITFEQFSVPDIKKSVSLTFNDEYSDSLAFLYDSLSQLINKIKNYIIKNSIYNNSYKIKYEIPIKEIKKLEPKLYLININEKIKRINDKIYIPDFLSDGTEDLKEMMNIFWDGLFSLLYYSKPIESVVYHVKEEQNIVNIKDWLKERLDNHFNVLDELLESDILNDYSDMQIKNLYEKIISIKIPKEINPRSETDMNVNKCFAEKKLEELIGLDNVKEMIEKIKAYVKASKGSSDLNLHMAFYGNPGTGKTEVAKLIGEILYEYGALPKKNYVEATRSSLVAGYVGQTAIKTQAVIKEAMGGVLFIDEAYSLAIEGDTVDFGNEAVAELIQAMENNKGKFCVILAGYKNPLQKMLSTNPGFNSRIQFHVDFSNYSRDEISEILKSIIDKKGYLVNDDALNKMLDVIDVMRKSPDFANARDARNIAEQCIMCLNLRSDDSSDKLITIDDVNKYIKDANLIVSQSHTTDKIQSGEEQLDALIGLSNVKLNIKKIKAYAKKNNGSPNLNLHMAFTGNPGTGKTEVANIISRLLYEAGVLPEAKLIVANRSSLVGQHIGETAIKTKSIIQKSMGGVLFIDEAYSLYTGLGNDFGAEAIATLIDEMEKNKGKFCVVLAGYEKPLKNMISSNPGFSSRIQFWINFPDYSREELEQIIITFLKKEPVEYTITNNAMHRLLDVIDILRENADFANARTARNILQDIIMNQNLRTEDDENNNEIDILDIESFIEENGINIW